MPRTARRPLAFATGVLLLITLGAGCGPQAGDVEAAAGAPANLLATPPVAGTWAEGLELQLAVREAVGDERGGPVEPGSPGLQVAIVNVSDHPVRMPEELRLQTEELDQPESLVVMYARLNGQPVLNPPPLRHRWERHGVEFVLNSFGIGGGSQAPEGLQPGERWVVRRHRPVVATAGRWQDWELDLVQWRAPLVLAEPGVYEIWATCFIPDSFQGRPEYADAALTVEPKPGVTLESNRVLWVREAPRLAIPATAPSPSSAGGSGDLGEAGVPSLRQATEQAEAGDRQAARRIGQRVNDLGAASPIPGWSQTHFRYDVPATWCLVFADPVYTRASNTAAVEKRAVLAAAAMGLLVALGEDQSLHLDRDLAVCDPQVVRSVAREQARRGHAQAAAEWVAQLPSAAARTQGNLGIAEAPPPAVQKGAAMPRGPYALLGEYLSCLTAEERVRLLERVERKGLLPALQDLPVPGIGWYATASRTGVRTPRGTMGEEAFDRYQESVWRVTAQVREAAGGLSTPPGRAQPAGNPDDAEAYALLDLYLSFMDARERDAWWQRARERGLDALLRDPPTPAVAWASLGPGDIVQAPQSPMSPEQYLRYRQAAIDVTNRLCETARAYPQAPVGPSVWEGRKPWQD